MLLSSTPTSKSESTSPSCSQGQSNLKPTKKTSVESIAHCSPASWRVFQSPLTYIASPICRKITTSTTPEAQHKTDLVNEKKETKKLLKPRICTCERNCTCNITKENQLEETLIVFGSIIFSLCFGIGGVYLVLGSDYDYR